VRAGVAAPILSAEINKQALAAASASTTVVVK